MKISILNESITKDSIRLELLVSLRCRIHQFLGAKECGMALVCSFSNSYFAVLV